MSATDESPGQPPPDGPRDPRALTPAQVAELLTRAGGGRVTEDMVLSDLRDGAPANADGTVHLVHYAAWLAREVSRQQGGGDGHRSPPPEAG